MHLCLTSIYVFFYLQRAKFHIFLIGADGVLPVGWLAAEEVASLVGQLVDMVFLLPGTWFNIVNSFSGGLFTWRRLPGSAQYGTLNRSFGIGHLLELFL